MRDLFRTGALALVLASAAGIAAAQAPATPSPQSGAAQAAPKDVKGGEGNPTPDQVVGPPNAGPVPMRGQGLDLPGATPETTPAKYSPENAARAEVSIMGVPVPLDDAQKRAIWESVADRGTTKSAQGETVHAETGVFLPPAVEAEDFPQGLSEDIPALRGLKYVKIDHKVLLVKPANGIVRGVIEE